MRERCQEPGCNAPKGLCKKFTNQEFLKCPSYNKSNKEEKASQMQSKGQITTIPWSGVALQPSEISLVSHRSSPKIIGIIGAASAGKTSYLGMLYTLLFNGKKFEQWCFAGSYTLIAWETLAKYLRIQSNGQPEFPEPTPSNPDFYSLYHLALRKENHFYDILFADSSGEVFTLWAGNIHDENAVNAQWIYQQSHAFIFFIDSEAIIKEKGVAKRKISQLASQVKADLNNRPIVIVWSKADLLDQALSNIKSAIEDVIAKQFPKALSIKISNFSETDPDTLCHVNNLRVTEYLLNELSQPQTMKISPDLGETKDFFFKYQGSYGNK
ncbi:MAG: hypothetical protein DWQ02_05645 [Bacteroidetes bacterium]|nr:MAG: hypothetical protein DWQ02_05645 [Bacteroidota bacterium]